MKIRHLAVAAVALTLPFAVAACGGSDDTNSGERPSAEELSTSMQENFIPAGTDEATAKAAADCMAKELEASELPNGVLRSLASGEDEAQINADNEDKYNQIVEAAVSNCTKELMGG